MPLDSESIRSAVSRAILKPVYQFGITSSAPPPPPPPPPKVSKVLISGVSVSHRSLSQSHESDVLSYSECKIAKNFPGLRPWTPLGKAYSAPQTLQLHNGFSPCYARRKTGTPQKLLDTALIMSQSDVKLNCRIKYLKICCDYINTVLRQYSSSRH